jgi:hypothetical protein
MERRDILARPIGASEDAEVYAERVRQRLIERDLDGCERALGALRMKIRAGEAVLAARRRRSS